MTHQLTKIDQSFCIRYKCFIDYMITESVVSALHITSHVINDWASALVSGYFFQVLEIIIAKNTQKTNPTIQITAQYPEKCTMFCLKAFLGQFPDLYNNLY